MAGCGETMDGLSLWNFSTLALKPQTLSVSGVAWYNPNDDPLPILGGLKIAAGIEQVAVKNGAGTLTFTPAFPRGILVPMLTGFNESLLINDVTVTPVAVGSSLSSVALSAFAAGAAINTTIQVGYFILGW